MGERTIVIGVAGGTGSGKSTLVRKLQEAFSDAVTTLSHDYYYRAYPDLTYKERTKLNYDHPHSFETDLMIEQIRMLRGDTGRTVRFIPSSSTIACRKRSGSFHPKC